MKTAEDRRLAVYGAVVAARIQQHVRTIGSEVSEHWMDVYVESAERYADQAEEAFQRIKGATP